MIGLVISVFLLMESMDFLRMTGLNFNFISSSIRECTKMTTAEHLEIDDEANNYSITRRSLRALVIHLWIGQGQIISHFMNLRSA